ncbi:MAG TPA: hypothetical protein DEB31_07750 [Clostridiales bacterium]|nr:hypothetical protein [Clostridiales bacterium]
MKKILGIAIAAILTATLAVGCAPVPQTQNNDLSALEDQLNQISDGLSALQSDVDGIKNTAPTSGTATEVNENTAPVPQPDVPAPSTDPSAQTPTDTQAQAPADTQAQTPASTQAQPAVVTQAQAPTKTAADYDFSGFTGPVNDLVARMDAATFDQARGLESEANALDNQIEALEDTAERDFRQGLLSRADYRSVEAEAERLENLLDNAEDYMEHRLGYDD